ATAEAQKEQMESLALDFTRKAGEHGTLFGSVTSMDIADAFKAKGYEIDRRKIALREPIKETGEYTVNVRLHRDVTLAIPITVTADASGAEPKPERKAKAESTAEAEAPVEEAVAEEASSATEQEAVDTVEESIAEEAEG